MSYSVYFVQLTAKKSGKVYYKVGYSIKNFKYRWDANDKYKVSDGLKRTHKQPLLSMKDLFDYKIVSERVYSTQKQAEKKEDELKSMLRGATSLESVLKKEGYKYSKSPLFFKGVTETFILSARQIELVKQKLWTNSP